MDAVAPEPVLRALLSIHRCCNPIQSNAKKIAASSAIQSHVVGSGFLARQFIRGPADLTPNEWKEAARTASCTRPCGACGRSRPLQEPVATSRRWTQKSFGGPNLHSRLNWPGPPARPESNLILQPGPFRSGRINFQCNPRPKNSLRLRNISQMVITQRRQVRDLSLNYISYYLIILKFYNPKL